MTAVTRLGAGRAVRQDGDVQKPGLVASDVDGTLLDGMERVSARTAGVVRRVTTSGTPFILVSGRPPRWIPGVAEAAGVDGYAVCANGAILYDIAADEIVSAHTLDPVLMNDVAHALDAAMPGITFASEHPMPARASEGAFLTERTYSNPWGDAENNTGSRAEVLGRPAAKLLVRHKDMTSDEMALVAETILDDAVTITFSASGGLLELSVRGVTKATGLAEAADRLALDATSVVAFGDMPNDIEMLKWAGHGVAMANAHEDVLAVADEITAPNVEDGVAQILERWF
jgi:Cof subfamily protein (haloacid dehalogenase superfamily)